MTIGDIYQKLSVRYTVTSASPTATFIMSKLKPIAVLILILSTVFAQSALSKAKVLAPPKPTVEAKDDPGCRQCVARAASMFANRDSVGAAQLLESWRSRCPGNAQLRILLSTILLRLGQRGQEAEDVAQEATKINPASLAGHFQYAIALVGNGHTMVAISEFEKVIELDPANYEAWSSLARLYNEMHEEEKSGRAAKKAASVDPSVKTMRERQFRSLENSGKLLDIQREFQRILTSDQTEPEALAAVAEEAAQMGAYQEGIQASNKVLAAYHNSSQALKTKALCEFLSGQSEPAVQTSEEWLKIDGHAQEADAIRGLAELKLGRTKEASENLKTAAELRPGTALTNLAGAELAILNGNLKEAQSRLREALNMKGCPPAARLRLAELCWKQGKADEAMAEARDASRSPVLKDRGIALEAAIKMSDRGSKDWQLSGQKEAFDVIASGPRSMEALTCEAAYYLSKKKPLDARQAINKMLTMEPSNSQGYYFAFQAAKAVNNVDQEKEMLTKCLELSPSDPDALAGMAALAAAQGETDRAIELYRKARLFNEESPQLSLELAKALEKKGETEESIKLYQLCLSQGPMKDDETEAKEALKRLESKEKSQ